MIAFVSLCLGTVSLSWIPFFLHQEINSVLRNSPPQSACRCITLALHWVSSIMIHSRSAPLVSLLALIGIAVQYRVKSSIAVRTYFLPIHSLENGPMRSAWSRSNGRSLRIWVILPFVFCDFVDGLVLFPAIQVSHFGADFPWYFWPSGRDLRVSKEICPYLSCRSISMTLFIPTIGFLSSGLIHIVPQSCSIEYRISPFVRTFSPSRFRSSIPGTLCPLIRL